MNKLIPIGISALLASFGLVAPLSAATTGTLRLVMSADDHACKTILSKIDSYSDHSYSKNGQLYRGSIEESSIFRAINWKAIPLRKGNRIWNPDSADGPFAADKLVIVDGKSFSAIRRSSSFGGSFRSEWIELYSSDIPLEEYAPDFLATKNHIAIAGQPGDLSSEYVLRKIDVRSKGDHVNPRERTSNQKITADFSNLVVVNGEVFVTFRSHAYIDVEKSNGRVFIEDLSKQWWRVFSQVSKTVKDANINSPLGFYLEDVCYFTRSQ